MNADDFEREHMTLDGPVRFRDRHSSKLALATLLVLPTLLGAMVAFDLDPGVIVFMSLVGAVGVALDLALSSYRVVLTSATLHVQHGLRIEKIPVATIERVVVVPHQRGDSLFGRGPYEQSLDGSVRRYRKEGLRDTVRVEWRFAGRRRTTIIGTDRAADLAGALADARRGGVNVRVEVEAAERDEAVAEVPRLERGATARR
ncbi:MAG: hypothetical protein H6719_15725 [Sandaracinaceae bacterium]|nr:hypothetical protein [Sandaracinaceae bacterium]